MTPASVLGNIGIVLATALLAPAGHAWEGAAGSLPAHLRDRGTGIPTSMSGSYVRAGELLVFPSFDYYRDQDFEYDPAELGFSPGGAEFRGRYQASEGNVLLAYGLSDRLAVELTGAVIRASLQRAAADPSNMPAELEESGLGDVRTRLNWRWLTESGRRPEVFGYVGIAVPHDAAKRLVGTPDWVGDAGLGVIRGYSWGTVTFRAGVEFDLESASVGDWGEVALEYLRRLSPRVGVYGALVMFEGDELSLVTELQWHLNPRVVLKLNNGLGLTEHGIDWAPRVGVLFSFPGQ